MNNISFKTLAFIVILCIVLGIFVARGLNSPTTELVGENNHLEKQVAQLTAQISQQQEQIGTLKRQVENPPAVQTAQVGLEFGWRVALLVLLLGGAVAVVSYLFQQARLIRPNQHGQFPVVVDRTLGQTAYTDLNLQVAPTAILEKPTLRAQLGAQIKGRPELVMMVATHGVLDTQSQFEVKRGTQLLQVMIASGNDSNQSHTQDIRQRGRTLTATGIAALLPSAIRSELPPVNVIELRPGQEQQIARVFQKHAAVY